MTQACEIVSKQSMQRKSKDVERQNPKRLRASSYFEETVYQSDICQSGQGTGKLRSFRKGKVHIVLENYEENPYCFHNDRFEQCISSITNIFFSNKSSAYMNDVFKPVDHPSTNTKTIFLKLSQTSRKTNYRQKILSCELKLFGMAYQIF